MPMDMRLLGFGAAGVLIAGAAVLVLAPVIAPDAARAVRPLIKAGVRRAAVTAVALQRRLAELEEDWEDLLAEIRHDLTNPHDAAAQSATDDAPPAPRRTRTRKPGPARPRRAG